MIPRQMTQFDYTWQKIAKWKSEKFKIGKLKCDNISKLFADIINSFSGIRIMDAFFQQILL